MQLYRLLDYEVRILKTYQPESWSASVEMSWLEVTLRLEGGDKLVSKVDLLVFMLNLLTRLESREVVLAAMLTTGH